MTEVIGIRLDDVDDDGGILSLDMFSAYMNFVNGLFDDIRLCKNVDGHMYIDFDILPQGTFTYILTFVSNTIKYFVLPLLLVL